MDFATSDGEGTKIWIDFREKKEEVPEVLEKKEEKPEKPKILNALVVDDNGIVRYAVRNLLQAMGFPRISAAQNGKEAQGMLRQMEEIDLIVADWNMPEMDGGELLSWVRQSPNLKSTVFILLSADSQIARVRKAAQLGVSAFVGKPFSPDVLQKKIEEFFPRLKRGPKRRRSR